MISDFELITRHQIWAIQGTYPEPMRVYAIEGSPYGIRLNPLYTHHKRWGGLLPERVQFEHYELDVHTLRAGWEQFAPTRNPILSEDTSGLFPEFPRTVRNQTTAVRWIESFIRECMSLMDIGHRTGRSQMVAAMQRTTPEAEQPIEEALRLTEYEQANPVLPKGRRVRL